MRLVRWWLRSRLSPVCLSVEWFPYDCGPADFGYAEWRCRRPRWHRGDHRGTAPC